MPSFDSSHTANQTALPQARRVCGPAINSVIRLLRSADLVFRIAVITSLTGGKRRDERLLRHFHVAEHLHALLAGFLLLQQLTLTRDVAAIALCQHVLAQMTP